MDLVQCDICGVVPEIRRSHSSRLIVHKCKDYSSGWHGHNEVVSDWNDSNSSKSKESTETGTQHTHDAIALDELESSIESFTTNVLHSVCDSEHTLKQFIKYLRAQQHHV